MNKSPSAVQIFLYVLIGLILAAVAVRVLAVLLGAVSILIQVVINLGVVLLIGYIVYALIAAVIRSVK